MNEILVHVGPNPERWLPIEGWPGYDVSDWGRVRSWRGGGRGQPEIKDTPQLIGNFLRKDGYRSVILFRNNKTESRQAKHHTLVLEAFVGPKPEGCVVCHGNGDQSDNRLENLRWDTQTANRADTRKHGRIKTILKEEDVPEVWRRVVAGHMTTEIARDFDVPPSCIYQLKTGRIWVHLLSTLPGWPLKRETDAEGKEPIYIPAEVINSTEELWREIDGFPAYRISHLGRVQSRWNRVYGYRGGSVSIGETWNDIKTYKNNNGYYVFTMSDRSGQIPKQIMKQLHLVILAAFACPKPAGYVGCHIDGDRTNNAASNLRWDTYSSNANDRHKHARERLPSA